jgi:hypothetical protein
MKRNHLLTALVITVVFMSCRTPEYFIYSPSPPVNPFFKEKGDSKLSAYISGSSGSKIPGADLQAGYAITNHVAITGAFYSRKERDKYYNESDDSVINNYRRRMGEVGIGYFTTINRRKNATFNVYGGYGWGRFLLNERGGNGQVSVYTRMHESNVKKLYLQPSVHFMPGKVFRAGLVTRFSFVNYDHITTNFSNDELNDRTLNQFPGKTYLFIEPTVNFQFVFPPRWLTLDMGLTLCPTYDDVYEGSDLRHRTLSASMGITLDLGKINSKK